MTHHSDRLVIGGAITNTIVGGSGGLGVKTSQAATLDIVPLTKNATAYAASQTPASAALTLSAGTGVTAVVDAYGVTRYVADVARCVSVTSGGNDSGINWLITGFDAYGAALSQLLAGANAGVATTKKAFMSVVSIVPSGAVATTATAGTADVFGLPIVVADKGYISGLGWNNTLGFDTGTMTIADSTSPATSSTGDVRGTYAPSSASNGTKRLVLEINMASSQAGESSTTLTVLGVPQA